MATLVSCTANERDSVALNKFQVNERREWLLEQPFDFETHYPLADYPEDRVRQIMFKYLQREANLTRAWARICHHLPETISPATPLSCLELGTAHGGMLEIWRHYGHEAVGTDWPWRAAREQWRAAREQLRPWQRGVLDDVRQKGHDNPRTETIDGWAYQPIIEAMGLEVRLVDGRTWPYPFEDKSFDVVCAYQAIDAFGPPEAWTAIVAELCRIARRSVLVGYNPLPKDEAARPERQAAARGAWLKLQSFEAHGLCSTFTEFGRTRRGLHPVATKFIAA